jgi:hypothetical protein
VVATLVAVVFKTAIEIATTNSPAEGSFYGSILGHF